MALKLNSTGGGSVTLAAGSTASNTTLTLPSFAGSLVGADTIGNVGIGTSSPSVRLDVQTTTDSSIAKIKNDYGSVYVESISGGTNRITSLNAAANASKAFAINGAGGVEWMRINSSGNVGIGNASPGYLLTVGTSGSGSGSAAIANTTIDQYSVQVNVLGSGNRYAYIDFIGDDTYTDYGLRLIRGNTGANTDSSLIHRGTGLLEIATTDAAPIRFITSNTERMRIDSSGNLLIGTTSTTGSGIVFHGGSDAYSTWKKSAASGAYINFLNSSGGSVGLISTNGSSTTYATSSDYRLKENIQPMQNALGVVAQLKPVTYNWKADGSDGQGFIAHELQAVVPDCVTGEKDAVDDEGKPVYQGIDTSFLVATLTKAIQEQQEQIEQLKAEVAELKGV
jgi:hypothetical protein